MKTRLTLVALAVAVTACAQAEVAETTTSVPPATTPLDTADEPGTTVAKRGLETFECDDVPEEVSIVCEAYEVIQVHYVDDISDVALAEAALLAVEAQTKEVTEDPLACAVPTEDFVPICDAAADTTDNQEHGEGLGEHD